MGLSIIVGSIALLPASLALALRHQIPASVTYALAHIAATGFIVAAAAADPVARFTTGVLLKNKRSGKISPLSQLLMWPYHFGLQLKLLMRRKRSSEPLWNEIQPGWYLGSWCPSARLLPPGSPSVVDVTCELPRRHGCRYLCLPTWDTQGPAPDLIEEGVRWSLRESNDGRPVYIHCAHGHGRSAVVMCAAFIAAGKAAGIDEAVALLRQARPRVRLNKKQRAVLQQWVDRHHSSSKAADAMAAKVHHIKAEATGALAAGAKKD